MQIEQVIKKLMAAHVILPARIAFVRAKTSESDGSKNPMINELLSPLKKTVSLETQNLFSVPKGSSIMNAIPMFFDYALKLLPTGTLKQRMTEVSWLRALFIQLAECLSLSFPLSEDCNPDERVIDTFESLLRLLVENSISLDITLLENIMLYLSGMYQVELQHKVRWVLVGLCMQINPDLAIPLRSKNIVGSAQTRSQANIVLNTILAKLTRMGFVDGFKASSEYDVMFENVVLRLLKNFSHARNMRGFLDILEQQVGVWEMVRKSYVDSGRCSVLTVSIWEDESLLQTISEHLEQALTAGQISEILYNLCPRAATDLDTLAKSAPELYAQVVVLDCILSGIKGDSMASASKNAIETISQNLSANLRSDNDLPKHYRWRAWRALSMITSQFSYYQDDMLDQAQDKVALPLIEQRNDPNRSASFYEALFALRFLISTLEAQETPLNGTNSEALKSVIRTLVGSIPSVPPPDKTDDWIPSPYWDGTRETVTTRPTLILACAAQIASAPNVLRYGIFICSQDSH